MEYFATQTSKDETYEFSSCLPHSDRKTPESLDVRYEVAFEIGHAVPEVAAIFTQLEGRILRVWTVVPRREEGIYKKIYEQERQLLNSTELDGIEFEFNIIPSMGKNPREVVADPACTLVFAR